MPSPDKRVMRRRADWQPKEITGLGECERDDMYMDWVGQADDWGCGVAILAMLTDDTYDHVKATLEADAFTGNIERDWSVSGVTQIDVEHYLTAQGWFSRKVYAKREFGVWPPPPFADRHYAIVRNPGGGHFVVMDYFGRVLDPLRAGFFGLADWAVVNAVVGITRRVTLTGGEH